MAIKKIKTKQKKRKLIGDDMEKPKRKKITDDEARKQNPKAFVYQSRNKAKVQRSRTADREQKKLHVPVVDIESDDPPPYIILVQGPPGVGKSTLIQNLIKHYTKQNISSIKGPITLISGKNRRLTFIECPQDVHGMLDASKYADLVLLMVDGAFGFEMETFEFLNMLQVHGFPKVMGVLTHLDTIKDLKKIKQAKKNLKHRFWEEIYDGAKLFYLTGLKNGKYKKREVLNLSRFISVMKFRPLSWRMAHPYLIVDRFEDVTPVDMVRGNLKHDRDITVFGYGRGSNFQPGCTVHIAGVGDFKVDEMESLQDPCPLPSSLKKRTLDKDKLLHAPMSDTGGLLYDKDAVYINIPDWQKKNQNPETGGEYMVRDLQSSGQEVDKKLEESAISMFLKSNTSPCKESNFKSTSISCLSSDSDSNLDSNSELDSDVDLNDEDSDFSSDSQANEELREEKKNVFIHDCQYVHDSNGRSRRKVLFTNSSEEDTPLVEGSPSKVLLDSGSCHFWKSDMLKKIANVCHKRPRELHDLIYGDVKLEKLSAEDDTNDHLFNIKQKREASLFALNDINALDSSVIPSSLMDFNYLKRATVKAKLRNKFVTGNLEGLQSGTDTKSYGGSEDSDDELFNDESVQSISFNTNDKAISMALQAVEDEAAERNKNKALKKAMFNSQYDQGDLEKSKVNHLEDTPEDTYYDAVKKDLMEQSERTRKILGSMNAAQRIQVEGYRSGSYLRLKFKGVPYELVHFFKPTHPILIGGVKNLETTQGFLQIKLKRHRWFPKLLKNRDPLIFSVGWRRFQTVPLYATEDQGGRLRVLKYTPEHMHCFANIHGFLAPLSTGVLALQSASEGQRGWRISATGFVSGLEAAPNIVKKIKLTGTPVKILKNTAFIGGMFNSALEVAKFEGASIRTVSGIRGTLKKAMNPGKQGGKSGTFRATFEDKILMSDIVFLRAWVSVKVPQFYNPVTNLLEASSASKVQLNVDSNLADPKLSIDAAPAKKGDDFGKWTAMKTVAELRRSLGVGAPRNKNSLYKNIERVAPTFKKFTVPKALQAQLPFKSKPKNLSGKTKKSLEQRRAAILNSGERKAITLVQQLNALRNAKELKAKQSQIKKRKEYSKKLAKEELTLKEYNSMEKKKRCVAIGLAEKHKSKPHKH